MWKKSLIALGLLAATTLSGCVVYTPGPPRYGDAYVYGPPAPVVIAPVPIVPVFGFYGGWYRGGWGYRGGYHGHWR